MRGNPAGVCLLDADGETRWMQSVAEEMNQAETAFAWREGHRWRLRWFTPVTEVDLCGHATLAAAAAIFSDEAGTDAVDFDTRSGILSCRRDEERVEMTFPAQPVRECPMPASLSEQMAGKCTWFGEAGADYLAVFEDEEAVWNFAPDFGAISAAGRRGLAVTAPGRRADMVSRFFAPQCGIPEDSVTGSLHCALAPYFAARLHKTHFRAVQASKRGGELELELRGDRVVLRGLARVAMDGRLLI